METSSSSSNSEIGYLTLPTEKQRAYEGMHCMDIVNMIATIAIPILLLAAAAFSIYFGIKPIAIIYQVNSQFAFSIPFVVCSGIAMIHVGFLTIHVIRRKSVKRSFEKLGGSFVYRCGSIQEGAVRYGLHPEGRQEALTDEEMQEKRKAIAAQNEQLLDQYQYAIVEYQTRDGVTLRGLWKAQDNFQNKPTVIIFHGNGYEAASNDPLGLEYQNIFGFNVFLAEYRGYGGSDGTSGGPNQEIEAYLDAEASLKFLLDQGISKENIIVHGYSLGGAYAASLGHFFDINTVILDHTFTNFAAVMHNVVPILPRGMTTHIVDASYNTASFEAHPEIEGAKPLQTDGWDSLRKVGEMEGEMLVIRGEDDDLMDLSFGEELIQAKYDENDHLITVEGGHCDGMNLFNDGPNPQFEVFGQFLIDQGFVDPI